MFFTLSEQLSGHRFTQGHSGPTTVDGCTPAVVSLQWHISDDWSSYYTAGSVGGGDYAIHNVKYGALGDTRAPEIGHCYKVI